MQIFINYVEPSDSIELVKIKLSDRINVPVFEIKLHFIGRQLSNDCTLSDYRIQKESTLHFFQRNNFIDTWNSIFCSTRYKRTIEIFVKISSIETKSLEVEEFYPIFIVKQMLNQGGKKFQLFFGENKLEEEKTLSDYNIKEKSTLNYEEEEQQS